MGSLASSLSIQSIQNARGHCVVATGMSNAGDSPPALALRTLGSWTQNSASREYCNAHGFDSTAENSIDLLYIRRCMIPENCCECCLHDVDDVDDEQALRDHRDSLCL